MALLKLGIFLRDQRAWKQGKKAVQGVIIFGPPDADSRCLVVSVAKPPSVSNTEVSKKHISRSFWTNAGAFCHITQMIALLRFQGDTFNLVFLRAAKAAGVDLPQLHEGFNACVNRVSSAPKMLMGTGGIPRLGNDCARHSAIHCQFASTLCSQQETW